MGIVTNRRRVMGGKPLPYDARIEYLASQDTQRIDTGIINKDFHSMRFVMDFLFMSSSRKILFGNYDGSLINILSIELASNNKVRFYTTDSKRKAKDVQLNHVLSANTITTIDVKGDCPTNEFTYTIVNGNATYIGNAAFSTENPCEGTIQLGLFSDYRSPLLDSSEFSVYSSQIYGDDVLLRDFIPVRVGQVGYMYDRVSGQLFGNAGTGAFVVGPDVNN